MRNLAGDLNTGDRCSSGFGGSVVLQGRLEEVRTLRACCGKSVRTLRGRDGGLNSVRALNEAQLSGTYLLFVMTTVCVPILVVEMEVVEARL